MNGPRALFRHEVRDQAHDPRIRERGLEVARALDDFVFRFEGQAPRTG